VKNWGACGSMAPPRIAPLMLESPLGLAAHDKALV